MNASIDQLSKEILAFIKRRPAHFLDVLRQFEDAEYRSILSAWSKLRSEEKLGREEMTGKYIAKD